MTTEARQQLDHTTARIVEELAAALLPHLKEVLSTELAEVLSSAERSASRLSDDLRPLSGACEMIQTATERLEQISNKSGGAQVDDELLRSISASLLDWEGILKANGRANTRELNEFSAEVSEQVGWMKSSLPEVLEEELQKALRKAFLPHTEENRAISESVRALEVRFTRLERIGKIILVEGIVLIAALAAAVLYFI